jgi:Rrf2 family protein
MTTEYAVRTLMCLSAGQTDMPRRIGAVAAETQIPESYLRKIIPVLTKAGFVRSTVGVTGGIQLASSAQEITLLDVFEAMEGKMALNKCLIHPSVCHRTPYCPVHDVWSDVQNVVREKLRNNTMADLAKANSVNLTNLVNAGKDVRP